MDKKNQHFTSQPQSATNRQSLWSKSVSNLVDFLGETDDNISKMDFDGS